MGPSTQARTWSPGCQAGKPSRRERIVCPERRRSSTSWSWPKNRRPTTSALGGALGAADARSRSTRGGPARRPGPATPVLGRERAQLALDAAAARLAGDDLDLAEEARHPARGRPRVDLLRRADLLDHPVAHHRDRLGDAQRLGLVVGDEQRGHPGARRGSRAPPGAGGRAARRRGWRRARRGGSARGWAPAPGRARPAAAGRRRARARGGRRRRRGRPARAPRRPGRGRAGGRARSRRCRRRRGAGRARSPGTPSRSAAAPGRRSRPGRRARGRRSRSRRRRAARARRSAAAWSSCRSPRARAGRRPSPPRPRARPRRRRGWRRSACAGR